MYSSKYYGRFAFEASYGPFIVYKETHISEAVEGVTIDRFAMVLLSFSLLCGTFSASCVLFRGNFVRRYSIFHVKASKFDDEVKKQGFRLMRVLTSAKYK